METWGRRVSSGNDIYQTSVQADEGGGAGGGRVEVIRTGQELLVL